MAETNVESSGFKVVDRRNFTSEGERLPDQTERKPEPEPTASVSQDAAPSGLQEPEWDLGEASAPFATLVSYLSTTAMFQLGLLPGPGGEYIPSDFPNARRTIELLEVLQEKTHGNLTKGEAKLLDDVLYELRMSFVEVQRQQKNARK